MFNFLIFLNYNVIRYCKASFIRLFYHRNASSFRDENKMHHLPDAVGDDFRQAFVNERFVANNITDER